MSGRYGNWEGGGTGHRYMGPSKSQGQTEAEVKKCWKLDCLPPLLTGCVTPAISLIFLVPQLPHL